MKLSDNFSLEEMFKSQQAIRLGINNYPDKATINNLTNLCKGVLQPLREQLGRSVSVSSGYRSVELNNAIGGSSTSDHCKGFAADIEVPGMDNKELYNFIAKNFKFTQLILEFYEEGIPDSGWVHISYNPDNLKCEKLIAIKRNGKTFYLKGD